MRRTYHDLLAWQRSVKLAKEVYSVTKGLPDDERFGLVSQMRRAAVSVASNIAEGSSRSGKQEFLQFLNIAKGSLSELETQLTIAEELAFVERDTALRNTIDELFGLLHGLMNSLRGPRP
ncbi:MAG: four helix bundle protein [Betaproteobacteria bacterium RIFCSPLOWO2_12_FULL_62_13]|nr:MAG: four helix bundle protein [Betaproteobacteria bacterium RIFCSPLOWO2_12_FULL_62_13]